MKTINNQEFTRSDKYYGESASVSSMFALRGCVYLNDIKPPFRVDMLFSDYDSAKAEYDKLIERFDDAMISICLESSQQYQVYC